MKNKWLIIAGILVLLNGIWEIIYTYTYGGTGTFTTSIIVGLVIIYLGLYGIPKR